MNDSSIVWDALKLLGTAIGAILGLMKLVSWLTKKFTKMESKQEEFDEHLQMNDQDLNEAKTEARQNYEDIKKELRIISDQLSEQKVNAAEMKYLTLRIETLEKSHAEILRTVHETNNTVNNIRVDMQNKANR